MVARLIPTKVHAGMDYAVGVLLIAAPWLFGFADESTAATWVAVVAGVAMIGLSALTDYEGGFLARVVSMRTHLLMDMGLGLVLAISPWLFGFADEGANAWLPFVLIGVAEIGTAALTDPIPGEPSARRRAARSTT